MVYNMNIIYANLMAINFGIMMLERKLEDLATTSSTIGKGNFILFGGANGFYAFTPDTIILKTPKVVLTNLKPLNKNKDLGKAYELVEDIEVDYLENVLTFEFAAFVIILIQKTLDIIISLKDSTFLSQSILILAK